ncbi:MAG TPA: glycosyltransferase [Candidatus Saccharimonadia bacterium]|nr:glycosyltransferase [Candidatus Saccharimonadia bacterium]
MKKILVLTAPAGGGHTATAKAIASSIAAAYPDEYEVRVADVFLDFDLPIPLEKITTPAYSNSVRWLNSYPHKVFFKFASVSASLLNRFATTVLREPALKFLRAYDPDIIISTFPIISYGASRILKEQHWPKRVPLISIVTDAGDVHRLWLMGGDDAILVATPGTMSYAIGRGVPAERVHYLGFPVDERFSQLPTQAEARRQLGLDPDRPTVLVTAGGFGLSRKVVELARELAGQELGLQYIFIAGRNEHDLAALRRLQFRDKAIVMGYTNDMPACLAACDVVVGKAGWVSLYEAMVVRRPTLIMNVVPGQEEPNAKFIEEHGVGRVITNIEDMAAELAAFSRDPQRFDHYNEALDRLALDAASGRRIARFVHEHYGVGAKVGAINHEDLAQ